VVERGESRIMKSREQLKMDRMMRLLFKMSRSLTVGLINGLFGDMFKLEDELKIRYSNTECVGDDIFLEEDDAVGDSVALSLRLPNGTEFVYEVPTVRYWQLSVEELREKRMHALLPLQVFKVRKSLQRIASSEWPEEKKREQAKTQFVELKKVVQETVETIAKLHAQQILSTRDMDRMLRVLSSISNY